MEEKEGLDSRYRVGKEIERRKRRRKSSCNVFLLNYLFFISQLQLLVTVFIMCISFYFSVGKFKTQVVNSCRTAIKSNNTSSLFKIIQTGLAWVYDSSQQVGDASSPLTARLICVYGVLWTWKQRHVVKALFSLGKQ